MSGQLYPGTATPITPADFLAALAVAIPESTPGMRAVLASQSAIETGRWKKLVQFNFGNFKASDAQDHCFFTTTERLPLTQALADVSRATGAAPCHIISQDGDRATVEYEPNHPTARFRAYATIESGMADYVSLLRTKWSKAWSAAEAGDAALFVRRLHEAGYFTAGVDVYTKAVCSLDREFLPIANAQATPPNAVA